MESSNITVTPVKSNAVVKYSANHTPALFAELQCNTDLNAPPSNWLSNSASSYGLQHVLSQSTGFSSFRMAHMFPDCVGEVDVVSDAENIKNLLKLPYSQGQVSMMVHCIENTLLIDEFDVFKHLLRTAEKEWEWLRKFFYEHMRQSFNEKDRTIYLKRKSRMALQEKSLVSKFLYHSLVENVDDDEDHCYEFQNDKPEPFSIPGPALPEPNLEEEVPDPTSNHTYNRNVVWTFEDIQMLIGTDMPIFGGSTHPCISLRLRDMNSPISVLTGIDYWLDNLMSNVPEVIMCYHLNGIVQKYELIKTEDLPNLDNCKFSPTVIRDIAQNILSFLKSNATKAGHTYWLFKSKDDDVVKLYDLTSLCAKRKSDKEQNPFTIPVAMLLYRVARNMKHTPDRKQPGTIRMLLENCIKLLEKEKYPQIVTSSHYMISDLYIPANTDPVHPDNLKEYDTEDMEVDDCYEDDLNEREAEDIAIKQLRFDKPEECDHSFVYKPPPPINGTLDERCQLALKHVAAGLECLQYFPSQEEHTEELKKKMEQARKREEENNPIMAKANQPIPMPYPKQYEDQLKLNVAAEKKTGKKRNKNKNKASNPVTGSPNALLLKPNADAIPTWQEPDRSDGASWNAHLKTLLYEKACLIFAILIERDYNLGNYGYCIRNSYVLSYCHDVLNSLKFSSRAVQESCLLGRAGDAYFMIFKNWFNIDKYLEQLNMPSSTYTQILEQIEKEDFPHNNKLKDILPQELHSIEQMLLASCKCYEIALTSELVQDINTLFRRLGNVQNELGVFYMNRANDSLEKFQENAKIALLYLENGIKSFEHVRDVANLALLHSNMGRLHRLTAHYYVSIPVKDVNKERHFYNKAVESYMKALHVLGQRKDNPMIWDTVTWESSTAIFNRATVLQDYPLPNQNTDKAIREVVDILHLALKYCDTETPGPRQPIYQYRVATIHHRLASLYHRSLRQPISDPQRKKQLLSLCKLNFERACNLFKSLDQHVEHLKCLLKRVALSELLAKGGTSNAMKVKNLQYVLHLLVECIPLLNWIVEMTKTQRKTIKNKLPEIQENNTVLSDGGATSDRDNNQMELKTNNDDTTTSLESDCITFTNTVEQQLQYALRMLTKLCLNKNVHKGGELSEIYKSLYTKTLQITHNNDWMILVEKLLLVINEIKMSEIPLTVSES